MATTATMIPLPKCDRVGFNNLLHVDRDSIFTLDLSNYNVIQCIIKMCEIKKHAHPKMLKNYNMAIHQLELVQKEFNCVIDPIIINSLFWSMFVPYLAERGLKYSTIKTVVSEILSTLNWASKYGVKLSQTYDEVEVPKYQSIKVALTPDDISYIYHFRLDSLKVYNKRFGKMCKMKKNKIDTLTRVKDMFVLSCNLGQRHSDMLRINSEYFKNGIFSMVQQKTGNRCRVEIEKMAIDKRTTYEILAKYNYEAPYKGDIANYNHYLKELLILIGDSFAEKIMCENKINGMIIHEEKAKYNMISSHTARRSFATINTMRNLPRHQILRATGHSTESSFVKYICYDDDL